MSIPWLWAAAFHGGGIAWDEIGLIMIGLLLLSGIWAVAVRISGNKEHDNHE